jgi:plasmid maintenance system antidote protein VapI
MIRRSKTGRGKLAALFREETRRPVSPFPGEMLREEFLGPMELTPITSPVASKRAITADTGLRLDRYFGLSESWWLRIQTECDIRAARRTLGTELAAITPRQAA